MRAYGLEDIGDVKVRAKVVAGTLSETQTKHLQGVWGCARGKASNGMISRFVLGQLPVMLSA